MSKISCEVLKQLYLDEQKTVRQIAIQLGVASSTVVYYLKKFSLPTRPSCPRKGYWHSESAKKKISAKAKKRFINKRNHPWTGRKHTEASKQKMSLSALGINKRAHLPEWDGSHTDKHIRFRTSQLWKKTREKIFRRDNYTCQISGQKGGDLECHHIVPKSKLTQQKWTDENNLITLSKDVHKITKGKEYLFQRVLIDNLVQRGIITS